MVNLVFMGQTVEDNRRKLQKTEGGPGKSISELVEIAFKVYVNRTPRGREEGGGQGSLKHCVPGKHP